MLFSIDVWSRAGWTVIAVVGELEMATAPRLRQAVVTEVSEGRAELVLDLQGVPFVDSTGLGVVVGALKRVRSQQGRLVVAGLVPRVRSLFELTRLDEIIDLYDDVDAALRAVAADGGGRHG